MRYPQAVATRSSLSIRLSRFGRAAFALGAVLGAVAPAQVLEVHSDSLTTYKVAASRVQLVRPIDRQRAINLEGSVRRGSTFPMAIAGNPFEKAWRGEAEANGVRLDTGTWSPTEVDLSFPAPGFRWTVGRSYNARQDSSGAYDSDGYAGTNWFNTSQPEIVLYDDNDNTKDLVYLVLGADRYAEFKRTGSSSNEYKATNGAAGVFIYAAGTQDTYTLIDTLGTQYAFFGFDTSSARADGQLWTITDLAGNVAYVGSTNATDATGTDSAKRGWDNSGRILKAVDSANRRYSYTYNADATPHLSQVKIETKTGGSWETTPTGVVEVGKVDYTYYGSESYGDAGDLKTVTVTLPLSDSGVNEVRVKYFRYWEGTYNSSTNPGYPHAVQLVVDFEGARKYEYLDSNFDNDILTASTVDLKLYAAAYFEYDSSHQVRDAWFNGQCGCSGAATGAQTYRYETNGSFSGTSGYDTDWKQRTSVDRPDGSWMTQYFDEVGQPLSHLVTDDDPAITSPAQPQKWVTYALRDANGAITNVGTPASVTSYTHSSGAIAQSSSAGLIWVYARASSGDTKAYATNLKFKKGTSGSAYYERTFSYDAVTAAASSYVKRILSAGEASFEVANTILEIDEELYVDHDNTSRSTPNEFALESRGLVQEAVPTLENGENVTATDSTHYALDATTDFAKDHGGHIEYRAYQNGLVTKVIRDADTGLSGAGQDFNGVTIPSGFSSSGTELHHKTTYAYDAQGRLDTTTLPDGRVTKVYYGVLLDRRLVTIEYPRYVSGSGTYYGPAEYTVLNHAGKPEVQGVIAISSAGSTAAQTTHIDESDADPITAVDTGSSFGSLAQMRTSIYDEAGTTLEEERVYFLLPSSGAGSDGTNYDPTKYAYDDSGRKRRVKEAHGTITRTVFDARGQTIERWLGTNDYSFAGGEASGTDNMVKVESIVYDDVDSDGDTDDDGNGLVSIRTAYIQDNTTGKRETKYLHDLKGRAVVVINSTAPHILNGFDNLGRVRVTAQYSSSSGLDAADNPLTLATNRLALSETLYDDRGQMWKTIRHKIDASDGSDDDTLDALSWFNAEGELAKHDGEQLEKFAHDRLGRQTHHFVLGSDNDTTYAHALTVTGDIVLEERQTTYELDGSVLMEAAISRLYDDVGSTPNTGALDTNADSDALVYTAGNVLGRIQITSKWYDAWDRLEDVVQYGTNDATANVATFTRTSLSVPSRSDTALRTTYAYNTDGTLKEITDPKALVTRTEYDALGRRTKTIANYGDGIVGDDGGDDDQTVVYAYTDGLQVTITADLPSGETDQVTTYTFGTTKGTSGPDSKIATGHLLKKVQYPDSSDATNDIVAYAYNAQSQEIWKRDQATSGDNADYNIIETDYDDAGRQTARRVTQKRTAADGAVRRIATAYDSLGRMETVTQYDAATAGNVVDQVKNVYDGWSNLTNFRQDKDSTVGASGYWEVAYTLEKATAGRNTLRRTQVAIPGATTYKYYYRGGTASHDSNSSRVSILRDVADTDLSSYQYNGVGQVVRTYYDEPTLFSKLYTGAGTTFAGLDSFDRTLISKWTKDLATDRDIYKVTLGYDRNSNITVQDDAVHTGHDVGYTNDSLNRLTRAQEGTWGGSSITTQFRDQQWGLNQTGNWELDQVNLNGDADFTDTGELNDDRTHNAVNELTARDTDDNGTDNYTFTHDAAGNMTDDGEAYKYEWDAFYRLRKVKTQGNALVSEYWYNGLGYLITRHQDTDTDGDVDGSDKKFHSAYDERWRPVATFRESDSDPKERFLYHAAGAGGFGTSSYIDLVVMRDRDANTAWTSASDGVLEERIYYGQNWHADVSALVKMTGASSVAMAEWAKYSAYGVPFGMPWGDADSDGDCDSADDSIVNGWVSGSYDVRGDTDLDGDVDAGDYSAVQGGHQALGRGVLTASGVGNRKAYAGYKFDAKIGARYHGRIRAYSAPIGRWTRRDPLEYIDGANSYEYVAGNALAFVDPSALQGVATQLPPPFNMRVRVRPTTIPAPLPRLRTGGQGFLPAPGAYAGPALREPCTGTCSFQGCALKGSYYFQDNWWCEYDCTKRIFFGLCSSHTGCDCTIRATPPGQGIVVRQGVPCEPTDDVVQDCTYLDDFWYK